MSSDFLNSISETTKPRILLVEDHRDSRTALSLILSRQGFIVIEAEDKSSAIAAGLEEDFDILLCDILLPDGNGMEVLKALREKKSFPAIAVTARTGEAEIEAQLRSGFDLHISKPYSLRTVVTSIQELLHGTR